MDDLERDVAVEARIERAVDLSHPAGTDLRHDFVRTQAFAGRKGTGCPLASMRLARAARSDAQPDTCTVIRYERASETRERRKPARRTDLAARV